jgi:hypothetical protein
VIIIFIVLRYAIDWVIQFHGSRIFETNLPIIEYKQINKKPYL